MIKMAVENTEIIENYLRKARIGTYTYVQVQDMLKKKGINYTIQELKEKAGQI